MEFGVFLPVSGRASTRETLIDAALKAEAWGFTSVWCADRMIIPWELHTEYPYSEGNTFIVPPDRPLIRAGETAGAILLGDRALSSPSLSF